MGKLPILSTEATSSDSRTLYPSNEALPLFYMAEFSVMGVRVSDFAAVPDILEQNDFVFEQNDFVFAEHSGVVEVQIDAPDEVQRVLQALRDRGLDFEMSDVIDQLYQG